jgi:two-component system cell cycle sensor histidine kinase/response regulator CckA
MVEFMGPSGAVDTKPMRPAVLVVDDEPEMCEYVASVMTAAGYQVAAATRAEEALNLIEATPFELAILDVVMPKLAGDELARLLRQQNPDIKVLFVTGYSEALFQARPILWEGEAFLEKPFTPDGLLEAVWLLQHGQLRPASQ